MKKRDLITSILCLSLVFLQGIILKSYAQEILCPDVVCVAPCIAFDGSTCECLPKGCKQGLTTDSTTTTNNTPTNTPFCINNEVVCADGIPRCIGTNRKPVCGSALGFREEFSGPGCTNKRRRFFDPQGIFCDLSADILLPDKKCKTKKLCKSARKKSCREDRTLCKCICQFETDKVKHTPKCNKFDEAICPKKLTPSCSNPNNKPTCNGRKLFCETTDGTLVDLADKVICK